jgi:hypothetical protein
MPIIVELEEQSQYDAKNVLLFSLLLVSQNPFV